MQGEEVREDIAPLDGPGLESLPAAAMIRLVPAVRCQEEDLVGVLAPLEGGDGRVCRTLWFAEPDGLPNLRPTGYS